MVATVEDIAQAAGVSVATVSRVLNGSPKVASGTRRRVLRLMDQMAYAPNNLARNLRARGLRVFGLVISDIRNPFFTEVERGVEDAARASGLSVLLTNTDEQPEREAESLRMLLAERVAGVILVSTGGTRDESVQALLRLGIPLVALDRPLPNVQVDTVQTDNTLGVCLLVEHLLGHGHTRLAIISGPHSVGSAAQRARAFADALERLGLERRAAWDIEGDFREAGGHAAATRLLDAADRPAAVLVANNRMMLGALRAAQDLGLRIPDDVAIVGFDDPPWASLLAPPLTTVAHATYDLGRTAAELLERRLAAPHRAPATVLLPPTLVVRASCGPH